MHIQSVCQVKLLIERHCKDWDDAMPNMRQALTAKTALPLHQSCAMFSHFLNRLETSLSSGDFDAAAPKLRSTFLLGGMDGELLQVASGTVPPGDLKSVGAFRLAVLRLISSNLV